MTETEMRQLRQRVSDLEVTASRTLKEAFELIESLKETLEIQTDTMRIIHNRLKVLEERQARLDS
ncbi:MAG: hypothetical protein ACYDH4_10140 [Candidatus Cryosericum sp.]